MLIFFFPRVLLYWIFVVVFVLLHCHMHIPIVSLFLHKQNESRTCLRRNVSALYNSILLFYDTVNSSFIHFLKYLNKNRIYVRFKCTWDSRGIFKCIHTFFLNRVTCRCGRAVKWLYWTKKTEIKGHILKV